jgi:hypothetical protein
MAILGPDDFGADDFDADEAERYGWINRALPDAELDAFVARLARRIASFPADAVRSAKRVLTDLTLPGADAIHTDARRFHQLVVSDAAKDRTAVLFAQGLQARGPLELDLGDPSDSCHKRKSRSRGNHDQRTHFGFLTDVNRTCPGRPSW